MVFQVTMMLLKMVINYEFWNMNLKNKCKIKLYKKHSKDSKEHGQNLLLVSLNCLYPRKVIFKN